MVHSGGENTYVAQTHWQSSGPLSAVKAVKALSPREINVRKISFSVLSAYDSCGEYATRSQVV